MHIRKYIYIYIHIYIYIYTSNKNTCAKTNHVLHGKRVDSLSYDARVAPGGLRVATGTEL